MEQYALDFSKYFNIDLKNYFKLPETYTVSFKPGRVVLTPDQPSQLLDISVDLYDELYQQLIQFIQKRSPKSNNINLVITSSAIFIHYETLFMPEEMYQVVASYLSSKDLDTFCDIIRILCSKDIYWTRLIQEQFGWGYPIDPKYSPKTIYLGLLYFFIEEPEAMLRGTFKLFPGVLEYVLKNDLKKIHPDNIEDLMMLHISLDLAKILIDKNLLDIKNLYIGIQVSLEHSDAKLFMMYYQQLIKLGEPLDNIKTFLNNDIAYFVLDNPKTTIEMYELVVNIVDSTGNIYDNISDVSYVDDTNVKLAQHVLDKIPAETNLDDIDSESLSLRPNIFMMVLNKFKFSKSTLRTMLENFDDFYEMSRQVDNYGEHEERVRRKLLELLESEKDLKDKKNI